MFLIRKDPIQTTEWLFQPSRKFSDAIPILPEMLWSQNQNQYTKQNQIKPPSLSAKKRLESFVLRQEYFR